MIAGVVIAPGLGAAVAARVRVVREYERAIVFRLGRLMPTRG